MLGWYVNLLDSKAGMLVNYMSLFLCGVRRSQSGFPFDCKCIVAWNFWPRTRLTVNKFKKHIFVCFYNLIHI